MRKLLTGTLTGLLAFGAITLSAQAASAASLLDRAYFYSSGECDNWLSQTVATEQNRGYGNAYGSCSPYGDGSTWVGVVYSG